MSRAALGLVLAGIGGALLLARSASGQPTTPVEPAEGGAPTPIASDAGAPPAPVVEPPPADAGAPPPGDAGGAARASAIAATGSVDLARFRYANTWDLNLEGGGGYVFGGVDKWSGFVRARPGILVVRNDDFWQLGATAEYLGLLHRPAFGIQGEYLNLQVGGWFQLGGSIDTKGRPGVNAALGFSIFGVEAQVREFDQVPDPAFALIGKIRLPLGILIYGLTEKKGGPKTAH